MCLNNTSEIKAMKSSGNQLWEKTPSETVKERPHRSREKEEMRTKKMKKSVIQHKRRCSLCDRLPAVSETLSEAYE